MKFSPATRRSLLLTLGILGLGFVVGRPGRAELERLRSERRGLAAGMTALNPSATGQAHQVAGAARDRRAGKPATGKELAGAILAELKELKQPGSGRNRRERLMILTDALGDLDLTELRAFIAGIQQAGDLSDPEVLQLLSEGLTQLGGKNPEMALTILSRGGPGISHPLIAIIAPQALAYWARSSPEKVAAWLDAAMAADPGFLTGRNLNELASRMAAQDAATMLTVMARQLSPYEKINSVHGDSYRPWTQETFKTMHDYVQSLPEGDERTQTTASLYRNVASSLSPGRFDEVSAWLDQSQPDKTGLNEILRMLSPPSLQEDAGKWLAWVDDRVPLKDLPESFQSLMRNWANDEPEKAVAWARQNPDPATRDLALQHISGAIEWGEFTGEPAERIAMALPEGPLRTATLEKIYAHMPGDSPEAAEAKVAFGEKHGLR